MRILILSAGRGSRLGSLTKRTPKPLIEVNGKPVLERVADHFEDQGFGSIIVNVSYHYEKIMEYFGTRFLYFYEPKLVGTAGTVRWCAPWLASGFDDFLVVNADTLTNLDVKKMYDMHTKSKWSITVLKDSKTNKNAGAYMFNWRAIEFIPFKGMIDEVLEDLPKSEYRQADLEWIDIGTPEGLKRANAIYEEREKIN